MLLLLCCPVEGQETLASPEVLLLGGFDGLDIMSHSHSYNQEDDVTSAEM